MTPPTRTFSAYLCLFYASWTAYVLLLYPHVQSLGQNSLAYAAVGITVRLLLWILPVLLYLKYVERIPPAPYLKLTQRPARGIAKGLALALLLFALFVVRFGLPHPPSRVITWNTLLNTSLGIGFFEEIPFRGFILQKLSRSLTFWPANLLSSLLFVALHLPGWLSLHLFTFPLALSVLLFSFAMGALFHYAKSLWPCIVAHSAYDCLSSVLFPA